MFSPPRLTELQVQGWLGRQPGLFDPDNVKVGSGSLQLWANAAKRNSSWPPGYDNYTTSTVRSMYTIEVVTLPSCLIQEITHTETQKHF